MLEVIYSKLDNIQTLKDTDGTHTQSMWQNLVQNALMSYIHTLETMSWADTEAPTIDQQARQLQEYKNNVAPSKWDSISAVDTLTQ